MLDSTFRVTWVASTSPKWDENRPFSLDSHVIHIKRRNILIQSAYFVTPPHPEKHHLKRTDLI